MSYTKNKKPLETFTNSDGYTIFRWKRTHARGCRFFCECCAGEWDCNCGAATWEAPK